MVLDTTSTLQKQGKLETAHRIIQTAGQVFRYAIQKGFASYNPAPDLKGALPPPVVKNMAAMIEPKDFAELLRSIDGYQGTLTVQCALKLAPLLFQRIGELRHMKWADLDFENNEWRYLVTKTKTQHIVPLSRQALAIIETMRPYSGHGLYVFQGGRTHERPMSENAINAALRKDFVCPEMEDYRQHINDRKSKQSEGGKKGAQLTNSKHKQQAGNSQLPRQDTRESLVQSSTVQNSKTQSLQSGDIQDEWVNDYDRFSNG